MNSDEKNKCFSNSYDCDPDFRRKDRNEQIKDDKSFMKGHKRINEDPIEQNFHKGVHHDPYNEKLGDPNRHNIKYNKNLERDGEDINREESPTNRDLHYKYIPEAKIKTTKQKPQKVSHQKFVDLPADQKKQVKKDQNDTEIIHNKNSQFSANKKYKSS